MSLLSAPAVFWFIISCSNVAPFFLRINLRLFYKALEVLVLYEIGTIYSKQNIFFPFLLFAKGL